MQCSFSIALVAIWLSHGFTGHLPSNSPDGLYATAVYSQQQPEQPPLHPNGSGTNKKYRAFNHHDYEIVDTAYFFTYYRLKAVEKIPNKGTMMVGQYYFSKTGSGDIYELSISNLKNAFPDNNRFHYAMEEEFRSDKDLMAYDTFLKEYKLKYIFSQSLKD